MIFPPILCSRHLCSPSPSSLRSLPLSHFQVIDDGMAEPERKKRGADNQLTQDNWEDDGGDGDDAEV